MFCYALKRETGQCEVRIIYARADVLVKATLAQALRAGASRAGEPVRALDPDGREATFVYARDPEGNILEPQSRKGESRE